MHKKPVTSQADSPPFKEHMSETELLDKRLSKGSISSATGTIPEFHDIHKLGLMQSSTFVLRLRPPSLSRRLPHPPQHS